MSRHEGKSWEWGVGSWQEAVGACHLAHVIFRAARGKRERRYMWLRTAPGRSTEHVEPITENGEPTHENIPPLAGALSQKRT